MRVISQGGKIDVPYETGSFNMICADLVEPKRTIIYYYHSCFGTAIKLAEYSAEAKAIKAMEMLREQHENVAFLKTIINTEKGASFVRGLSKTDFDKMTQNYFQFPQDDEIEV